MGDGQINIGQVIMLLSRDIPYVTVADAMGCSASYISQLAADPEIKERVHELKLQRATEAVEHDDAIDAAESQVLKALKSSLPFAVGKPAVLAAVFKALNGAKRAAAATSPTEQADHRMVTIRMPVTAAVNLILAPQSNEIVGVGTRELVTMPSNNVTQIAQRLEQRRQQEQLGVITAMEDLK